ncbi:MAG: hypothetical protein AB1716_08945, partial [Planctomycetota bacterium]
MRAPQTAPQTTDPAAAGADAVGQATCAARRGGTAGARASGSPFPFHRNPFLGDRSGCEQ